MSNRQQLEQAIAVQESLRGTIDDAIIDATIQALRAQLSALEAAAAAESRRAQATLLFIDLAGHTELIQGRDPEEIMEIIDQALMRLAGPVSRHGGRIVRFQGDGYKAIFGLPTAGEHDPDNAVLAGLDILQEAGAIAAELEAERGMAGFQVRVGIDTGLVLIGGGTEGEDAVTGLPVNLAARLESAASPGTVLISQHTYQHIRGVFDVQPLPPIEARGFPDPVGVYRVLRQKARSFRTRRRGVEGVETRMVGRDAELAVLQALYECMIEQRECLSAVVVGDAGLGKSRLLYEFENWADLQPANVNLYRGRARLETQRLPYGLLRDVFVFRCGIHDDDSAAAVRGKLVEGFRLILGEGEAVDVKAHVVGHMLGYDFSASPHLKPLLNDARQLRSRALHFMTDYFRAAAEQYPLLLLLEDLHWADDSSLDAIIDLVNALVGFPVMLLGATRPALYERRPAWLAGHPGHRRIDLALLGQTDSGLLVTDILQKAKNIPHSLKSVIVDRAEGNPFYVEELVKMLIEDGVIVKGDEVWHVEDGRLADLHVPATLTGVLQARLDALPPPERGALQVASVVGRMFWDAAVEYIEQDRPGEYDENFWPALRHRELVFQREDSSFEGTREFLFKHALLRDVTYESVLKRRRRDYHRRAAEWLIQAGGERVDEYADQVAAHYAAAGARLEEAEWQARAGRQAARQYAAPEAVRALSRALELVPADDLATRYDLLSERRKVYHITGDRALEAADLADLERTAAARGDERCQAEVAGAQAIYFMSIGEYEQASTASTRSYALAESAGDVALQAQAISRNGNSLMFLGDYEAARANLERALSLARSIGDMRGQMETVRILGIVAEEQGDFVGQWQFYEEALALARELGDRYGERRALNSLGVAAQGRGDYRLSAAYFEESLAIANTIGDRMGAGTVLGNLGVQKTHLGQYVQARQFFEQSLQIARETDDQTGVNINLLNLGAILTYLAEYEKSLDLFAEALRGARETGDKPLEGYVLNGLGLALVWGGRAREAIAPLREAIALRDDLGQPHLAVESHGFLAEALAAEGDVAGAASEAGMVLDFLVKGQLEEAEDLLRVLLAIYRALTAAGDERAAGVLDRAYRELQTLAAQLDPQARQVYLENVPWNRAILALWHEKSSR